MKDQELNEERNFRAEALERSYQKERTLIFTRRQYDKKLRKSDEECKDSQKTLTAALLQVKGEEGLREGKERKGMEMKWKGGTERNGTGRLGN